MILGFTALAACEVLVVRGRHVSLCGSQANSVGDAHT